MTVKELRTFLKKKSAEQGSTAGYFLEDHKVKSLEAEFTSKLQFPVKVKLDKKGGATFSIKCASQFEFERLQQLLQDLD